MKTVTRKPAAPELLTMEEAAHRLRLDVLNKDGVRAVRDLVRAGKLRAVSVTRYRLILADSIDAYLGIEA